MYLDTRDQTHQCKTGLPSGVVGSLVNVFGNSVGRQGTQSEAHLPQESDRHDLSIPKWDAAPRPARGYNFCRPQHPEDCDAINQCWTSTTLGEQPRGEFYTLDNAFTMQ